MTDETFTSGEIQDFDPEHLPEGAHVVEHVHERSTIMIRIGDRAWIGIGTFDDVCRANGGIRRNHELPPGMIQLRVALRRALNQIMGRVEADLDPDGMTWSDACALLGEIQRHGAEGSGSCTLLFIAPVGDNGRAMRFHGRGETADEAAFDLAKVVLEWQQRRAC